MMQLGGSNNISAAAVAPQTRDAAARETEDAAAAVAGPLEGSEEMSDRGFGGNRWPRQETLALLKIRSDMDIAFRDASVKGPLWDEVSRKMADLGYKRSGKKCKEKFENVYKYHKRTKDGRIGKSEGKTYRFFDQLEALENQFSSAVQTQTQMPPRPHNHNNTNNSVFSVTLPELTASADNHPPDPAVMTVTSTMPQPNITVPFTQPFSATANPIHVSSSTFPNVSGDFLSDSTSSSSSSTSSDVEISGGTRKKRKRKWKDFFERLMKQVVEKQDELQRRFLEAMEKREHDRMVREEAWRMQEMARINREREILSQERSMAAAKDAAVMTFLQKLSDNPNISQSIKLPPQPPQPQQPPLQTQNPQPPHPQPQPKEPVVPSTALDMTKTDNGDQNFTPPSSSRWPKVEIEALIKLRTNLDSKYQENGPKGPLWEEISAGMRRLGFNRNAKRCKEKWENINKYFKKVKESNRKRPEDSKTCPYFYQLDALYREKNKFNFADHNMASTSSTSTSTGNMKPENAAPLMVQPEQQWPPAPHRQTQTEDMDHGENFGRNPDHIENNDEGREVEGKDDEEEEDDDEDGGEFEIVPSINSKGVTLEKSGRDACG